ncbi:kelch domain-containing protein 7B [Erinaceus europaeus]|uniref:Kelch domain-containing protein 7B n=1 Tax=Erinaceus europaeus TaxID=9365 RepID=A0A1S2ZHJ8_ERIEU|nr:kelch domain-containing protein 7B [Erinaceus europaeus]
MIQGISERFFPGWGWDEDGEEDWEGPVLTLLALAVVAATALALHWFGSGQDQEVAGSASTAPEIQPATLLPKSTVSDGIEGQSSGEEKSDPARCGQVAAGVQDQEPPGVGGQTATAAPLLKTPGQTALGQQYGNATSEAPQSKGVPLRPGTAPGESKEGGTSAPLVIHFTLRSPGREVDVPKEAGSIRDKAPTRKARVHAAGQDTGSGLHGAGAAGSLERGPSPAPRAAPVPSAAPKATPAPSAAPGPSPAPSAAPGPSAVPTIALAPAPFSTPAPAPTPGPASAPDAAPIPDSVQDPIPAPTPTLAPVPSPSPTTPRTPASGSRPASQGPSVARCKQGQISTSWENLISMVLRSHPFPRQERFSGRVPRAALGTSNMPSSTLSDNGEPALPPDRAVSSLATGAGTGDLTNTACEHQQSSSEVKGVPTSGPPSGSGGHGSTEKRGESPLPRTATTRPLSRLPGQPQPGSIPARSATQDAPPVPRPRKRSLCEMVDSAEQAGPEAPHPQQGEAPGDRGSPVGGGLLTEKQKEARKLMVFLQRPGSWGVVEGPRKSSSPARGPASAAALQRRLDLGSCLDVLALAQQHREPGLAQEAYALMSDNLLHVLGDPGLYRQLSGAERQRILSLRTRGQAVLGVLVLPSLYQVSRPGFPRGPPGEEAPAAGPGPPPPCSPLHVFSPRENSWRQLTQVPAEVPLRGCGLCTMHNYLFLAGGIRGSGAQSVCSNEVFCYNPLTNIWSQVRPMQQARAQLKLVAVEGLLYAIGGECLYSMECYDPRTDTWTSRAPLPAGTFPVAHEAVACRGDIYVTGGHLFYRLLRYSPEKDAWAECPYSASHRRSSDMVALGGFLYRFDLLRGVGAAVMRYNTVTGSWSRAASLPLPDPTPLRCAVLGNTIYCLNHQVTATFTVSEGTAQFQAKELQPFPLGSKGVLCPFVLTLPSAEPMQTAL